MEPSKDYTEHLARLQLLHMQMDFMRSEHEAKMQVLHKQMEVLDIRTKSVKEEIKPQRKSSFPAPTPMRRHSTFTPPKNVFSMEEIDGVVGNPEEEIVDEFDARLTLGSVFRGTSSVQKPVATLTTSVDSDVYNMEHKSRGKCVIFNNRVFESQTHLNERRGTEVDAQRLYNKFRELDFDVKVYNDLSHREILEILESVAKEDHTHHDCFACCVLTHGDQGVLYGRDGKFGSEFLFAPFRGDKCLSLVGKPKLFFIQACQGDKLDHGVSAIESDVVDASTEYKVPVHADFLIAYSTIPGHYSWRNTTQGSWFIQALASVLDECAHTMDLLSMLTRVNKKVAYDFQSCVPSDPNMDKKKQVPCITSMLTAKVYFPPKI